MKKIAIIGSGITGLSTAFYLEKARRAGADLTFTVFERSNRLGGALLTEKVEGCLVEGGADSFLTEKPWAAELCRDLGIADQLVGSNDTHRQTSIVRKKKLVPLPAGMSFFVPTDLEAIQKSELFSARGKKRILREAEFQRSDAARSDVSVGEFVRDHFGSEMLERVADPLLAGIYGGDAHKLSLRAVIPRFLEMEERYGSLTRALRETHERNGATKPLFTSLKDGMRQLVRALTAELPVHSVQVGTEAVRLEFNGAKWMVAAKTETDFDAVVLATAAHTSARLLRAVSPETARPLGKIPYSSSVTVALAFDKRANSAARFRTLRGFGFLVPRTERHRMLACTFVQNKFPERVPSDLALLRVFFGGVHDPTVLRGDDDQLIRLARSELAALLNLTAEPLFARVHRWPQAMPQYNIGHLDLLRQISKGASKLSGLMLAGSAFQGVGVSDCVRQGRDVARQLTVTTRDMVPAT